MNGLYFNHIPRTGGISFANYIQNNFSNDRFLLDYKNIIELDKISSTTFVMGHLGNINLNKPKVSIFRNPLDQVLSMFLNQIPYLKKFNKDYMFLKSLNECFDLWLNESKFPHNFQSIALTNNVGISKINNIIKDIDTHDKKIYNVLNIHYGYDLLMPNSKIILDSLNSLEVIGITEKYDKFLYNIDNFLLSNNYIKNSNISLKYNDSFKAMPESTEFIKTLGKDLVDKILEMNDLDMILYESAKRMSSV